MAIEQDENGLRPDLLRAALEARMSPLDGITKKRGIPKVSKKDTMNSTVVTAESLKIWGKQRKMSIKCTYSLWEVLTLLD